MPLQAWDADKCMRVGMEVLMHGQEGDQAAAQDGMAACGWHRPKVSALPLLT